MAFTKAQMFIILIYMINRHIMIVALLLTIGTFSYTQNSGNEKNKPAPNTQTPDAQVQENGSWLITKIEPDTNKMGETLGALLKNNIIPQAIDRNIAGELLIIAQLSPPAKPAKRFQLALYKSEKELMAGLEEEAKLGWVPSSMDINDDAAFVLFLQTDELLEAARIVKIKNLSKITATIKTYHELGYLPNSISTFGDSLWMLFTKTFNQNNAKSDIVIRAINKDRTGHVLAEELSKKRVYLIDVAFTVDDKVLMFFHRTLE